MGPAQSADQSQHLTHPDAKYMPRCATNEYLLLLLLFSRLGSPRKKERKKKELSAKLASRMITVVHVKKTSCAVQKGGAKERSTYRASLVPDRHRVVLRVVLTLDEPVVDESLAVGDGHVATPLLGWQSTFPTCGSQMRGKGKEEREEAVLMLMLMLMRARADSLIKACSRCFVRLFPSQIQLSARDRRSAFRPRLAQAESRRLIPHTRAVPSPAPSFSFGLNPKKLKPQPIPAAAFIRPPPIERYPPSSPYYLEET